MPIIPQSDNTTTTPVSTIIAGTAQDLRQLLQVGGTPDSTALLTDYCNRISLDILRFSRWKFLQSAPQVFLTIPGITDYYVGSGTPPPGAYNTGLNLSDIFTVRRDSVFDRSVQQRRLGFSDHPPLDPVMFQPGRPKVFVIRPDTPYTISIFPPCNNPAGTLTPSGVNFTYTAGGSLPLRTYYVQVTFVDSSAGESAPCIEAVIVVPANQLLTIQTPVLPITSPGDAITFTNAQGVTIDQYNVYAASTTGGEKLQTVTALALGTNWTEPTSGLTTSGRAVSSTSTLATLDGYPIEFTYIKTRTQLTTTNQIIQIPDNYKDVVIAGVNMYGFRYLKMEEDTQWWQQQYTAGKTQMVKDANLGPRGGEYMMPDTMAVNKQFITGVGLDSGLESSIP